jgi:hypothetical protein
MKINPAWVQIQIADMAKYGDKTHVAYDAEHFRSAVLNLRGLVLKFIARGDCDQLRECARLATENGTKEVSA